MSMTVLFNSNTYNYEYFQQDDVCRLCWNKNAFTDIFKEESNNSDEVRHALINKIKLCLDIDLNLNTNPKKVCERCCCQIEKFYLFKLLCDETDRKLREIYKSKCEASLKECDIKIETCDEIEDLNVKKPFSEVESCFQQLDDYICDLDVKPIKEIRTKKYKLKRSPTYCNICRLDLENADKFASHNSDLHGIENGIFKCFGCDKRFKNRKTRLGHEIHYCKGLSNGYQCTTCCRYLPSRRMYEGHMRDHREKVIVKLPDEIFNCKQCVKHFKTKDDLTEHILEHGVKKKNFVCESCGRVFTRQDYLHKHKLTHTGEKQHVCPHCGFRTVQRSSLIVHIRKHTGERPYSCDVCPQRCVSSSNLRAHRRRHLGVKQFECTICGKRFGYKVSLSEHVCAAHAPAAPQTCPLCGARYARARALRRHLRAKHHQTDGKANAATDDGRLEET